jgi:hypothetical protein
MRHKPEVVLNQLVFRIEVAELDFFEAFAFLFLRERFRE